MSDSRFQVVCSNPEPTVWKEVELMEEISFEEALKRLEEITNKMESDDLSLEESIKNFEEGIYLSRYCSEKLEEAEKKVEILLTDEDGELIRKPFKSANGEEQNDEE